MADDNRPLQYARYAIGEIVLVVIGILIALQINSWSGERKARKIEIELIRSLITDLEVDVINLEEIIESNTTRTNGLDSLSAIGLQDLNDSANVAMVYSLTRLYLLNNDPFFNNDRTLAKLKNSDNVGILNKAVADSILMWDARMRHIAGQTEAYLLYFRTVRPIAFKTMPIHYLSDTSYYRNRQLTGKPLPPLVDDRQVQMEFFNNVLMANGVTKNYLSPVFLGSQIERTENFIAYLEETYALEE